MTHRSRPRWVIAGIVLLALLSIGYLLSTEAGKGREPAAASAPLTTGADAATSGDAKGRPRRIHDTSAAAEAKLRSLLEVREGEISCIHVPAESMAGFPLGLEGEEIVGESESPGLVGIISRSVVLEGLKDLHSKGGTIEGSVDADAEKFEWSGKRFQVTGTATTATDAVALKIEAREGSNSLECLTRLPPGGIVFLRSSHPNAEGMLLVVGQGAAEKRPEPEKTGR